MAEYTARFYEHFNDEFDFLVFIGNVRGERIREAGITHGAQYIDIRNDVQGIGKSIFADGQMWGNTEELQGLIYINTYDYEWGGEFIREAIRLDMEEREWLRRERHQRAETRLAEQLARTRRRNK